MMTYLCPKCGSYMNTICITTLPPRASYRCSNCGYTSKPDKEENWAIPLPDELRSDIITNRDIFKMFEECRFSAIVDYRPLEEKYIKDVDGKRGIIVWFKNGDSVLYFPKEEKLK